MLLAPALKDESPSLSPAMQDLLRQHFWCDFSDIIPSMAWDDTSLPN